MTLISMFSLVSDEPMEFQKTQSVSNSKRRENYSPFRERERERIIQNIHQYNKENPKDVNMLFLET